MKTRTVIVGGVAGGASAAARLRRRLEHEEIIVLERGDFVSFANCGLPYYVGDVITEQKQLTLQTPRSFRARFNIDVRIRHEVIGIDTKEKTVLVKDLDTGDTAPLSYDHLVLSPGAAPIVPKMEGVEASHVFTLRNIPDTLKIKEYIRTAKPSTAAVIGGGYIGIEMAENLKQLGLDVSIVELSDHLIASLDADMAADVHNYLRAKGIHLYLQNAATEIREHAVVLQQRQIRADLVIVCVGVKPDTAFAAKAGIACNKRGCILVDPFLRTNVADIYAVGDAVEVSDWITGAPAFVPLAGPANKEGRIAADNIAAEEEGENLTAYTGTQGSAVLKLFDMTVACSGLNEARAAAAGIDYDKTYLYSAPHATYYPGGTNMSIKAIWDKKTQRLLGAQIVGFEGVDKRMDVLATAMRFHAKITDLTQLELCYAPPFGSAKDPVNMLGFVAQNVISGKVKQFFWENVDTLPRDGSVTLLDVRTPGEFARGHIDGFVNIPLDELRARLGELALDKQVYVHCHSGQRSYIACRLLQGHGYNCYNLSGGWRLYESVVHDRTVPPYVCTACR